MFWLEHQEYHLYRWFMFFSYINKKIATKMLIVYGQKLYTWCLAAPLQTLFQQFVFSEAKATLKSFNTFDIWEINGWYVIMLMRVVLPEREKRNYSKTNTPWRRILVMRLTGKVYYKCMHEANKTFLKHFWIVFPNLF